MAESVTSVGDNVVLTTHIDRKAPGTPAGSGDKADKTAERGSASAQQQSGQQQAMTDIRQLATTTDERFVGRHVNLENAHVAATMATGSFWVDVGDDRLFVLPSTDPQTGHTSKVKQGDHVSIMGTVLELPTGMKNRLDENGAAMDEEIYVYANQIKPAT